MTPVTYAPTRHLPQPRTRAHPADPTRPYRTTRPSGPGRKSHDIRTFACKVAHIAL
ncbi:hypothetical protein [Streptomyces noursei]|uniref:hypothetical protein n=1 Tax=Streptomyces noursei TaxID=1971 RepID=UPI0030F17609